MSNEMLDKLSDSFSGLSDAQKLAKISSSNLSSEMKQQVAGMVVAKSSTAALSVAEDTATFATTGLGNALKGLWATMMANPLILVAAAVTTGLTAWNAYKQSVEDMRQATSEAANAFDETSTSINDYADKYKKLHDELIKANTTEERQQEIKSELLSLQQELNDKYGDEYGKVNLVTDAYNDQTEAIKNLNKAAAQRFLHENAKGLDDAEEQMTKQRSYTVANALSTNTDVGKEIYEYINANKDLGITAEANVAGGKNTGTFTLKVNADATEANKSIDSFMTYLDTLKEKYGEDNIGLGDIFDTSSNALNKSQDIIDEFGKEFKKKLIAEITTDNDLSAGFEKATDAVTKYNDALASGDETKILSARNDLNVVKNSIDLTSDEWKKYGNLMTEVFSQADTGIYDFRDALTSNEDGILSYIKSIKDAKLSKEDLLSMADDGNEDYFDELVKGGEKYNLTVEQIIDELIRMGVVQGDLSESSSKAFAPLSKQDVIANINSLSDGFESLDKIMNSISGDNPFDYALLDDDKFTKIFSALDDGGKAYENFIDTVSNSPKDIKSTQSAFDNLVTTWIDSSGVLNGLTEDNANLATAMLQNMGVANAEEVVTSRLAIAQEHLAAQKAYTADVSNELTNATANEIPAILDEATNSDIAKVALAGLVLEKQFFNGNSLNTSGDIENILSLVGVIGTANKALQALNAVKSGKVGAGSKADYDSIVSAAQKEAEDAIAAATNYKGKGSAVNTIYGGGVDTNKTSGSGDSSKKKDFSEIFDWISVSIEQSQKKVEKLQDQINDTSNWKPKNILTDTAISEMSKQIEGLQSQADAYQAKADSINLAPSYIDKIKNGTLEIETITDEVISNNIKDYQKWYGEAEDVRKKIDDVKKSMKELAQSKLDNIINDFDSLVSLMDKYSSYSKSLVQLQEDLGESISDTDYEGLIDQQEAIYNQLQNKYNSLSKELSDAVNSGAIEVGTDKWRKYQEELVGVNSEMNETVSSMNEFRQSIINLSFSELEKFADDADRVNNGISTMIDLIGSDGLMKDGMITSKGLTQIALYGQQYSKAKQQAAEYGYAIEAINEMYENGSLPQSEYNEKLNEYTSAQLSAVQATKEAQDTILQFRYDAIQAQIDDMNDLISAKKEALQTEKDYQDYLDGINSKQSDISNLQKKIDELSLSDKDDRRAYAQKLQLEEDLKKAKEELAKTQADYAYDKTLESLDKQGEEYEKSKNDELDTLKSNTDAQGKVIEDYLGQVKDNYKTVYNTLTQYGTDYNITMTDELTSPWDSAGSAVETFQSAVTDAIAKINIDIANIDLSRLTEMVSTMSGFSANGSSASFEDVTGDGTWQKTSKGWWYGNSNDDYVSDGIYTIGGKQYAFNEDGYMKTGWDESSGIWRYFEPENGQMVKSAWRKSKDGKDYYLKSDGTMATDMAIKSKTADGYYYVDSNGVWDGNLISQDEVKQRKLTIGYKNGTQNSKPGLKYVNEDGAELIVTGNGTVLNSVGNDTIFNKAMTDKLWSMSVDPSKFILAHMPKFDTGSLGEVNKNNISLQIDSPLMVVQGNADEKLLVQVDARLRTFINKDIPQKMMEMSKQR